MAARRSITCICICSAGGRSGPWFRELKYLETRKPDEEEKRRARQIARRAPAAPPEADRGQKETPGSRRKIRRARCQDRRCIRSASARRHVPRVVSASRALSTWLPARLGRA